MVLSTIRISNIVSLLPIVSIGLSLFSFNTIAQTEVTPLISLRETYVDNKTAVLKETGRVTVVSPGVAIKYNQPRLDLALDYQLNAVFNSGLQADDHENQSLNFLTSFTHQPNRWDTQIIAGIERINTNPNGIQIIGDINDSSNSKELRTAGVSTSYQNHLSSTINYQTELSMDYADIEGQADTNSVALNLGINNNRTLSSIRWNVELNSRKFENSDDGTVDNQIDSLQAGLNYRINRKISTFLTYDKAETNNNILNDANTTAGLLWTLNRNSFISIGAGFRGDDTTWSLDSVFTNKRLSLEMSYDERVTSERQQVFEEVELQTGLITTSQSLSITPVLLKKAIISLTASGKRTEFALSYFNQSKNVNDANSEEEQTAGLSFTANRTLSRFSSVLLSVSSQESQTTQKNTLNNIELSYNKRLSKYVNWSAEISTTEQTSDVQENEYEQALVGFSLTATF